MRGAEVKTTRFWAWQARYARERARKVLPVPGTRIKSGLVPSASKPRSCRARYRVRTFLRAGSKSKSKASTVLISGNRASLMRRSADRPEGAGVEGRDRER